MLIKTQKILILIYTFVCISLLIYIFQMNVLKNNSSNIPSSSNIPNSSDDSNDIYSRLDAILKNLNYNYIYTYESFSSIYFSIAQYNDTNFSINEYKVDNNTSINISIPSNTFFLISLPGSDTWTLNDNTSLNCTKLIHTSTITDWKNSKNDSDCYMGLLYHRDNFYFSTLLTGKETLQFKYPDGFIFNINLNIY